jgi:general secretion pathway protein I
MAAHAISENKSAGFTLLEVLIALVVFSVIAVSVSKAVSSTAINALYLEEKTLASWLAENRLTNIKLAGFAEPSESKDSIAFANRKWHVLQIVEKTPLPNFNKVTIKVAREETPDSPVYSLDGFIGKY